MPTFKVHDYDCYLLTADTVAAKGKLLGKKERSLSAMARLWTVARQCGLQPDGYCGIRPGSLISGLSPCCCKAEVCDGKPY